MIRNAVNRDLPDYLPGIGPVKPFAGAFATAPAGTRHAPPLKAHVPGRNKVVKDIDAALDAVELRDGMTISFHHHLRNGDYVLNMVLDAIARRGIKDLTLAPTALFGVHSKIIPYLKQGVVRMIQGSINGPIGREVTAGLFNLPVILRSHGGRARAIEAGELKIDVAFLAAPCADPQGNINGIDGPSACGPLGYAMSDAVYAARVVAITDNLAPYPIAPISIPQTLVDVVVPVASIGDPKGIASGTTEITRDPSRLYLAELAAKLINASGLLRDGFSFQAGAGGASLAVAAFVDKLMRKNNISGSFGCGGITSFFVRMLEDGLFQKLTDVQSFDLEAVKSLGRNKNHIEISALQYASPHNAGCVVHNLDCVILSATEVDVNFNVNVNTEADGALLHGIGGHMDCAAGAKLTIIVQPLFRGRIPMIVQDVITVTTPGETIDAIVTERGIAINPRRPDLIDAARQHKLPVKPIEQIKELADKLSGPLAPLPVTDKIIAMIEYRDGTVIDVVRQPGQ